MSDVLASKSFRGAILLPFSDAVHRGKIGGSLARNARLLRSRLESVFWLRRGEAAKLFLAEGCRRMPKVSKQVVTWFCVAWHFVIVSCVCKRVERAFCRVAFVVGIALSGLHAPHHTLRSTLRSLHSTLYPRRFTLYTVRFILYTPHSTLHTPHCILDTPHFTLYTPHFTLHTILHTRTLHFTLYTPHPPLATSHSALHTVHSTRCTFASTLHTLPFTLSTLHSALPILHFAL